MVSAVGLVDPALDRAGEEPAALGRHLGLDLLAHGAAEQVGLGEAVAGEIAGDLLHLLLIGDDAVGRREDRLELGVQVFDRLAAELARAIGGDVGHRAGTVERHQRDEVLEAVGPHVDEGPAHALAFHLEHPDGLAARQALIGLGVVEGDAGEIDLDAAGGDELHRRLQHGQRLEAEEIEFDEAGLLHPFHVELGHRHVGLGIAIERHQFRQRPVADHDAGGMGRGVAVEAFELLRDGEGARDDRLAVAFRLQPRLAGDGGGQRHRRGRILRHQLAQLVDLPVGHFEHAADVAQHAAGLQAAEGDDLRHLIAAVAALHVADHLVATVLAEVDVEVRHRHAIRVEEPLEDQAEADRVEIGDGERERDQRARARAAAGADRDALRLRPLDEIGDDEEVAGIIHPLDDAELEGEPLVVLFANGAFRHAVLGDAAVEPFLGALAQFARLVDRLAAGQREPRQDRLARHRAERAALRDLDGGGQCLRQVGKLRRHLRAGLEAVLDGEVAAVRLPQHAPLGDAQQRVVGLVVFDGGEARLVGGDERNALGVGEIDERGFDSALLREAMALQLHIEAVAESGEQRIDARGGQMRLARGDDAVDRAVRSAGQADQPVRMAFEPGELDVGRLVAGMVQKGARIEVQEIAVAGLGRGEQHQPRQRLGAGGEPPSARTHLIVLVAAIDRERAADDRLDARTRHLFREFERTEHVVGVGERQGRLVVGLGEFGEPRDRKRAFQQRIRGMKVEMDESDHDRLSERAPARSAGRRTVDSTSPILRTPACPCPASRPWRRRRAQVSRRSPLQHRQNLGPNHDHPDEQGDRCKCGGFLDDSADHDASPVFEHIGNIVHDTFQVNGRFGRLVGCS